MHAHHRGALQLLCTSGIRQGAPGRVCLVSWGGQKVPEPTLVCLSGLVEHSAMHWGRLRRTGGLVQHLQIAVLGPRDSGRTQPLPASLPAVNGIFWKARVVSSVLHLHVGFL